MKIGWCETKWSALKSGCYHFSLDTKSYVSWAKVFFFSVFSSFQFVHRLDALNSNPFIKYLLWKKKKMECDDEDVVDIDDNMKIYRKMEYNRMHCRRRLKINFISSKVALIKLLIATHFDLPKKLNGENDRKLDFRQCKRWNVQRIHDRSFQQSRVFI